MLKRIFVAGFALVMAGSASFAQEAVVGDAAAGEAIFKRCAGCHAIGEGAQHRVGPHLNDVFGRVAGSLPDYNYSPAMKEAGANGVVWEESTLTPFLADPRGYIPGTKMSFPGIKDPQQLADVIAYLRTFSPNYVPADGGDAAAAPADAAATAPANAAATDAATTEAAPATN